MHLHALLDDCTGLLASASGRAVLHTVEGVHERIAGNCGCRTTSSCARLMRVFSSEDPSTHQLQAGDALPARLHYHPGRASPFRRMQSIRRAPVLHHAQSV